MRGDLSREVKPSCCTRTYLEHTRIVWGERRKYKSLVLVVTDISFKRGAVWAQGEGAGRLL